MLKSILQILEKHDALLVAVTKMRSEEAIMQLYDQGHRIFGENRVQELLPKYESMPKDIEWHLIGHLQSNKVKYIAPFVKMIHSVDSPKLIKEINKQAARQERTIDILLQFHIASETTKFGFDLEDVRNFLENISLEDYPNVRICGVMGMATFTNNEEQVRAEFRNLKSIFDTLKDEFFSSADYFKEISMGMSGDYEIALEEGSTMVRIGSLLFNNL